MMYLKQFPDICREMGFDVEEKAKIVTLSVTDINYWFAAASFSPRSDNDDSKHPVFVDDSFGKPVLASDVIQNRDGEFSSRCSTSKELFDFNVEVAQNR